MSVALEIRDGNPWWLSLDIRTVPGNDPEGAEGTPAVGTPCYVWTRVQNTGTTRVVDATVRFYWANPGVGFDRTTAQPIGTAFVSLESGESQEVLCLTPWLPSFVNGGHECLLAEAFHPSLDPLPLSPAFDVPTDRHVAQRNLTVLAAGGAMFRFPIEVHNPSTRSQAFTLDVQLANDEHFARVVDRFGSRVRANGSAAPRKLGLAMGAAHLCGREESGERTLDRVVVPARGAVGVLLVGEAGDGPSLVHVVQRQGDREIGGLSVLLLPGKEGKAS